MRAGYLFFVLMFVLFSTNIHQQFLNNMNEYLIIIFEIFLDTNIELVHRQRPILMEQVFD